MANYDGNQGEGTQLRKLFVGGLSANIGDEELRQHFGQYGELADVVVMKDRSTGRPRGFGFVTFVEESGVDAAQGSRPHILDGREVETKRAMPRTEAPRDVSNARADKMFLGGLGPDTTEDQLREYFSQFGEVQAVEIAISRETGKSRGFGFVTYRDPDSVDKAILHKPHSISGSQRVDCKKAVSREQMAIIRRQQQGPGGYGGGYGGYGGGYGGGGYGGSGYGGGGYVGGYGYGDSYGDGGGYGNGGGYGADGYGGGGGYQNGDGFGSYGGQGYGGGPSKPGGGYGSGPQRFQPYGGARGGGPVGGGGGPVGGGGAAVGRGGFPGGGYRGGRGGHADY